LLLIISKSTVISKFKNIGLRALGVVFFLLLALLIFLSIPAVQSNLAKKLTKKINSTYKTNIVVKKVDLSFLGKVNLKNVEIRDHHQDTLIYVKSLKTSLLDAKRIIDNELNLGSISLSDAYFYMRKYKGEKENNLSVFTHSFTSKKKKRPFVLNTDEIFVENLNYKITDDNKEKSLQFSASNISGNVERFRLNGSDFSGDVRGLSFVDDRGIEASKFSTDFKYSNTQMQFLNTHLVTKNSSNLFADIIMQYKKEDLSEFTDKVFIKASFDKSEVSIQDLQKFYDELSGDDLLAFSGNMEGVLNDFKVNNVDIESYSGMKVQGDMSFLNAVKFERGFVYDAELDNITSNYQQLKNILPNVLGKKLPTQFSKLGDFNLSGIIKVTPEMVDTSIFLYSNLGTIISDLELFDIENIDEASYYGEIEFVDLDLGRFVDNPNFGKISLQVEAKGKGFKVDNIDTELVGVVSQLDFKDYNYQNLSVNGVFQNKKFDGLLVADDDNVRLNFKGLADFSSNERKFDFTTDIEKIDFTKINLFKRDSIGVLKGNIKLDVTGNSLDNVIGKAKFSNLTYINSNKKHQFKTFEINSSLIDSIKTIEVNSKDIVQGKVEGKFTFKEILPVFKNALGSVYTNYQPIPITPNQFVNFDFVVHNQIVNLFFPEVTVSENTKIKGRVNANKNSVKINFSSPKLDAFDNVIEAVKLRLDNQNKLYNTHLTADKIAGKFYQINKLNLINRTVNDTLFFKTIFKGGKRQKQDYDLNFYYTIDSVQQSVVGLQKSTFSHNNFNWVINPNEDKNNKVGYFSENKHFNLSPFLITSENQKVEFSGDVKGDNFKNLKSKFTNFQIASILPEMEKMSLSGIINGAVELQENEGSLKPKANLTVSEVVINDFSQGILKVNVEGKNSLNTYDVDVSLRDYNYDNIKAVGVLDFSNKEPKIDLDVAFKNFEVNGFSDFGGEVLDNLRGRVSGDFTAKGLLMNPDFNGALKLDDAGLTFPYLNIDFDFVDNTNVQLKNKSFIINNMVLRDTKFDTEGIMSGTISHQNLKKWALDLRVNADNLLILDTKEVDEIPYYGRGFFGGNATISGFTSNLNINVTGTTQPETVFVIPLNDVTTIDNYKLIRFKTNNQKVTKDYQIEKIKGLNLKMDITVTKDAVAQVVIDKVSGSDLKGSGNGNLQIEIDTRGKFTMFGDLAIDNGAYNFKYGGIITKPFTVQKGGLISWNGDPFEAELDLTAVYRTKANPAQLLDNISSTRKIDVDLYTKITGGLFNSQQEFDIVIPNANSTIASELEFILNENDINTKMQHFSFLLAFGTFYNQETIGNSASTGLTGTAAQVASNILSNVLNSNNSKFQLGVGYTQGDDTDINQLNIIDDQVDVSVSTQLSDRVLVNGNLGVPVGAETQASVVGEVKVEVLLNEEGTLRANFFTKPNDIEYSIDEEGYTQGLGLSYQVNFNNLKELKEKIINKKKEKKKKDSILVTQKKLINFK